MLAKVIMSYESGKLNNLIFQNINVLGHEHTQPDSPICDVLNLKLILDIYINEKRIRQI